MVRSCPYSVYLILQQVENFNVIVRSDYLLKPRRREITIDIAEN